MSYQVALGFEDGVTRFVTCGPTETVADASYKARINIPLDCRDGACGTCKSLCESGEYDGGDYIDDALTDAEAEAGYCLPCQMVPQSDLVVQIPTTSDVAKTAAAAHPTTVTAVDRLAEGAFALTVELDDRGALAFLPGQYVNVSVPGTDQTRSYSFSTGPDEKHLSFLIKYAPGGAMSEYLAQRCAVGDRLELTGPMGSFFLRESERPLLLLAGGTGLAPVLSILESLAVAGAAERPVHLVHGTSQDPDVVYTELLDDYTTRLPGLTWDLVVSDPETRHPNSGYVTGLIGPEHLHDGAADIYLCGPPPMVEAVRTHLDEEGLEVTHFYYEKFTPAAVAAPDTDSAAAPDAAAVETPVAEAAAVTAEPAPTQAAPEEPAPTETAPADAAPVESSPAPAATASAPAGPAVPEPAATAPDPDDERDAATAAATPPAAIAARPVGFEPRTPGLFDAPAATPHTTSAPAIAARPVGLEPRVPGQVPPTRTEDSRTDDHTVAIGARPVGYTPRPVTLRPVTSTSADGTTSTSVSLSGGERTETITSTTGVVSGEVHPGIGQ